MIELLFITFIIGLTLGIGAMFGAYLYGRVEDAFASESNKKNLKRYKLWKN